MRVIQYEVLKRLKERGPKDYDILYVQFDLHRTGEVGPALQDLKEWEHIEWGTDMQVKITESGLRLLENTNHWV